MYQFVLGEADNAEDLTAYLSADLLAAVWPELLLPLGVRRAWEERGARPTEWAAQTPRPRPSSRRRMPRRAGSNHAQGGGLAMATTRLGYRGRGPRWPRSTLAHGPGDRCRSAGQ
jgi:hypothetical protein